MRTADPQLQQRRRDEILASAERCFVEKGFHQASVAEIAAGAGLSMGLMYRYFKSKDEIVLCFVELEKEVDLELIRQFAKANDLRAVLAAQLDALIQQSFAPKSARITVEVMAEAGRNPAILAAIQKNDGAIRAALAEAIGQQQCAGRLPAHLAPTMAASALMTLFDGVLGRALLQSDMALDAYKSELLTMLSGFLGIGVCNLKTLQSS